MKEKYDQDFQGTLNYNVNYILQKTTIYLHARTEKRKKKQQTSMFQQIISITERIQLFFCISKS